jgi:hypothetical protein
MEGFPQLNADRFAVSSLDKEIFDNKSLFDFVHDWPASESDDTTGRFTIIRTLDEYIMAFVLVL